MGRVSLPSHFNIAYSAEAHGKPRSWKLPKSAARAEVVTGAGLSVRRRTSGPLRNPGDTPGDPEREGDPS
jgi:hypothetical protein